MNLTTRQKRMGLPIEFYTIPFNDRVSLPKPRVPRIEGATCCAVGIKPLSRDPTGPRRKVDELTSPARAFDRSNPPDRVKFVRSLTEKCALCRGPGGRVREYDRSLQQRGVTGALKMSALRLGCLTVLMQSHVTGLVCNRPPTGRKPNHHFLRSGCLQGRFPNLALELDSLRPAQFTQIILAGKIRLQMLAGQAHPLLDRLPGRHRRILKLDGACRRKGMLHPRFAPLQGRSET